MVENSVYMYMVYNMNVNRLKLSEYYSVYVILIYMLTYLSYNYDDDNIR